MQFVAGEGPTPCDLMFIGEGPGAEEDKYGRPFVGKSGRELTRYIWHAIQRTRTSVYVTNLVKYRVPDNGDPTEDDINRAAGYLAEELVNVNPEVVVTLGRWSTRRFLGDVDMETVHGIPHWRDGYVVMPVIHPAAGLHSTEFQGLIGWDFEQLGKLLRGEDVAWEAEDKYPDIQYQQEFNRKNVFVSAWNKPAIGVDTEGSILKPWCLSYAEKPGAAIVNRDGCPFEGHIVLHNALWDIGVLRAMNATYKSFDDIMIMAYLLCVEPQGLKALAKRHCGMEMDDYQDLVAEASRAHAFEFLRGASKCLSSLSDSGLTESSAIALNRKRLTLASVGKRSKRTFRKKRRS